MFSATFFCRDLAPIRLYTQFRFDRFSCVHDLLMSVWYDICRSVSHFVLLGIFPAGYSEQEKRSSLSVTDVSCFPSKGLPNSDSHRIVKSFTNCCVFFALWKGMCAYVCLHHEHSIVSTSHSSLICLQAWKFLGHFCSHTLLVKLIHTYWSIMQPNLT